MTGLGQLQKDLCNVLQYTQELVSFKDNVSTIAAEPHPTFFEAAVLDLEGIQLAPDGDTRMRLKRLRETQPRQSTDAMFAGWTKDAPHPSPDKPPVLVDHRMLHHSLEEISDLAEAGLIDPDDAIRPRDADKEFPATMDVILRTAQMTEFRKAWKEYIDGAWAKWAEAERPRRRSIDARELRGGFYI